MRVAYFVGNLGAGGLERFVTRIALRAKASTDFEPVVCCLSERSGIFVTQLEESGVAVIEAPDGWRKRTGPRRELEAMLRDRKIDLVHSQVNFSLWQQFTASRRGGVKAFCVTERNCYPLRGWARGRRMAQFHALRSLGAHYTANSFAVAEHLARLVAVPVKSIGVLPNGVTVDPPRPAVRERIRAELGWAESVVGIGYVSRMAGHKGHALMLPAIHMAKKRGLPLRACFVGDGPERDRLVRDVERMELKDIVTFAGTVTNVDEYMEAFDIVALFSSREGMANVILEAMAAGKAVVASNIPPNAEVLDEGRAGVLVDAANPTAILRELDRLVGFPEVPAALGSAARRRAESSYSIDACYQRIVAHYRKALKQ